MISLHDVARLAKCEGASDKTGEKQQCSAPDARDCQICFLGEMPSGRTEHRFCIRPAADESRESHRFLFIGALAPLDGVAVATYLSINSFTQAEALVAELLHELRLKIILRAVYI